MLIWIERTKHEAQERQRKLEETSPGWFDQHLKQLPATCLTTQQEQARRVTRRLKGLQAEPAFRFGSRRHAVTLGQWWLCPAVQEHYEHVHQLGGIQPAEAQLVTARLRGYTANAFTVRWLQRQSKTASPAGE